MMVVFISRSEKKALMTVRRILDTFANRIGNDTWSTVITEDGLQTVKTLLRGKATKNTAVSCHWIRSRSRSELLWIVGNREKFNEMGIVPVNSTQRNISHSEWESNWKYMPQMTPIMALAALFHDWGKANDAFQKKLQKGVKTGDAFRHEWISCRMLAALIKSCKNTSDDREWLSKLSEWEDDEKLNLKLSQGFVDDSFGKFPPIATLIMWLIISHHRMPVPSREASKIYSETVMASFLDMVGTIKSDWGYKNSEDDIKPLHFKEGLLEDSDVWRKQICKWAKRTLAEEEAILGLWKDSALRPALWYMRISLMMADYFVSSQEAQPNWRGNTKLYANTEKGRLKQHLDEHLVGVAAQAMKILHFLPQFCEQMEYAQDVRMLRKKSPPPYDWQDKAAQKITELRKEIKNGCGWFIVNMASTGCGKTIANAKLMRAVSTSGDELRYVLALGLRSLTLQTGDEYRERIGLSHDELAVLVGDAAARDLHEAHRKENIMEDSGEVEDRDELLTADLHYEIDSEADFFKIFFQNPAKTKKEKAFLYKPVIAATIDHIVAATETVRGGKYMLPFLRLMTSDLVVDEVDDFATEDLWTVAHLAQLAGMLGRNMAISSATIPPDLAEALFSAYQMGRASHSGFFGKKEEIVCLWCDEFSSRAARISMTEPKVVRKQFHENHTAFVLKRAEKLRRQIVKRKARIASCNIDKDGDNGTSLLEQYFSSLQNEAVALHDAHNTVDERSGKKVSFGLIRMANIDPCVSVSKFLLASNWNENYDVRLMTYHSRQTRLLRHKQEEYLDKILKRKGNWQNRLFENEPIIRRHIDSTEAENLLFIVISTPVEEIGRDHDFDWAVVEPSSYRSIIQLAGRVLRHRVMSENIAVPNLAVMQYNLNAIQNRDKAFYRPGYETGGKYRLQSHDMKSITDESELLESVQSIPRIQKADALNSKEKLIDLEHQVMQDFNNIERKGAAYLHGYLEEYWWLTGVPQTLHHFREGQPQLELYYCYGDDGDTFGFFERDKEGEFISVTEKYNIERTDTLTEKEKARLWLNRDYEKALYDEADTDLVDTDELMKGLRRMAKKYGGVSVPVSYIDTQAELIYEDNFGLYRNKYEKE